MGTLQRFQRLCVYCGSSLGIRPVYAEAARLGSLVAAQNIEVVYGGDCRGLMGCLADAVLAVGGRAIAHDAPRTCWWISKSRIRV
jgi:predicted Rossmann-fold nucleotide-binding protein